MIIYDNVHLYPKGSEIVMGKEYKKNRRETLAVVSLPNISPQIVSPHIDWVVWQ